MRYFKAFEIAEKPFIQWSLWASSIEKLTEMGDFLDPLIVAESYKPSFLFGVCPLKIVDGELVERSEAEMLTHSESHTEITKISEYNTTLKDINSGKFTYASTEFPMYEVARIRYDLAKEKSDDTEFLTFDGKIKTITSAKLADFLLAYTTALDTLTNPNKSEE